MKQHDYLRWCIQPCYKSFVQTMNNYLYQGLQTTAREAISSGL